MTTATALPRPGFPFKRLFRDGVYTMVLNVLAALIITLVGGGRNFLDNLIISMCIGTIVYLLSDVPRLAIWGENKINYKLFFVILVLAVPIAQIAGSALAGALIGKDLSRLNTIRDPGTVSWMGFTLLAAIAGTAFFATRDRIARAEAAAAIEKARAEAVERQALQAQLQLLQAQIEPHMLFNTLANLQGMIGIDPEQAQVMLDQLIQYLRATLSSSRARSTTLAQEFALMEAYLGLMSVRMGARLAYTVELPAALGRIAIPPMLLQPLVENAIIHGLEPDMEGGRITVSAVAADGMLVIRVADTGRGLDAAPARTGGTRLGVANTRERLLAMYGERATLALEPNLPRGAVARLTFPIEPT